MFDRVTVVGRTLIDSVAERGIDLDNRVRRRNTEFSLNIVFHWY
jgi:hypothetical protein